MSPTHTMRYARLLPALLILSLCPAIGAEEESDRTSSPTPQQASAFPELEEKAEAGDFRAARQICLRYAMRGDAEHARTWSDRYRELLAADAGKGDVKAMMLLGTLYMTGQDYTEPSVAKTVEWFSRAAEAGEPSASFLLGDFYARQGNHAASKEAYGRSYQDYARLAQEGNLNALYWQGYMEQNRLGTEARPEEGVRKLEQAAEQGHVWAFQQLFKTYAQGIGTSRDEARSISYARKAADASGDPLMAWATACAYLNGQGVAQDETVGEHYLDIAAAANISDAIFLKGTRLAKKGQTAEALSYYTQAASMRHPDAMIEAALLLLEGAEGVEKDESRGLSLLEAAANSPLNSARAAYGLGLYYDRVEEPGMANTWYVTASDRGVTEAMARRGLLHLNPFSGLKWSPTLTYQWWNLGKEAGDATCTRYIRLFLYVFMPLVLILAFGFPAFLAHRLRKKADRQEDAHENQR